MLSNWNTSTLLPSMPLPFLCFPREGELSKTLKVFKCWLGSEQMEHRKGWGTTHWWEHGKQQELDGPSVVYILFREWERYCSVKKVPWCQTINGRNGLWMQGSCLQGYAGHADRQEPMGLELGAQKRCLNCRLRIPSSWLLSCLCGK